eukprot:768139-Hanusia_phi.AAC.3
MMLALNSMKPTVSPPQTSSHWQKAGKAVFFDNKDARICHSQRETLHVASEQLAPAPSRDLRGTPGLAPGRRGGPHCPAKPEK